MISGLDIGEALKSRENWAFIDSRIVAAYSVRKSATPQSSASRVSGRKKALLIRSKPSGAVVFLA